MDFGFFGMAFDFDHDGHLDGLERAADFSVFMGIMEDRERREALEDASLEPDDYDFDF